LPTHNDDIVKWQGLSAAWWSRHILRCTLWKNYSMGNRIPFRGHQWSSVYWQHHESNCMPSMGSLSVHSPVGYRICVYDSCRIKGRSIDSCKATEL